MQLSSDPETEAEPFEPDHNENKSKSIPGEEPWKCRESGHVLQQQVLVSRVMRGLGSTLELGGNPWRQVGPQMLYGGLPTLFCRGWEPPQSLAGGQARFCHLREEQR